MEYSRNKKHHGEHHHSIANEQFHHIAAMRGPINAGMVHLMHCAGHPGHPCTIPHGMKRRS